MKKTSVYSYKPFANTVNQKFILLLLSELPSMGNVWNLLFCRCCYFLLLLLRYCTQPNIKGERTNKKESDMRWCYKKEKNTMLRLVLNNKIGKFQIQDIRWWVFAGIYIFFAKPSLASKTRMSIIAQYMEKIFLRTLEFPAVSFWLSCSIPRSFHMIIGREKITSNLNAVFWPLSTLSSKCEP